jgi:hypothetical protein
VGGKEENGGRETQILLHLLKKQKLADYPTNENNISVSLCQGVGIATTLVRKTKTKIITSFFVPTNPEALLLYP